MAMGGGSSNGPCRKSMSLPGRCDVSLVVIFMVTAPMMTTGLDVNLPRPKAGPWMKAGSP